MHSGSSKHYFNMKENAIHFINLYIAKFEYGVFVELITNYKSNSWHVDCEDEGKEDFDGTKLKNGIQLYNYV